MGIEAVGLSKRFGQHWAVRGLTLRVAPGEIVGLLGPNGAGKSTTMRLLTGYLTPTSGEVKVNGVSIRAGGAQWRGQLGYLPEVNPLHRELYVCEYLSYVAQLHGVRDRRESIDYAVDVTGLGGVRRRRIGQLSKGYRQRVGLAATLIHNPKTIILDEPTTGLDPNQIVEIRRVIREVGRDRAILLSSHIMQEIEALCDRVAIIHRGELLEEGKTSVVMRSQNRSTVVVGFSSPVAEGELRNWFPNADLESLPNDEWVIHSTGGEDIREALFHRSVRAGHTIVTLYRRSSHLEDVFRALTAET